MRTEAGVRWRSSSPSSDGIAAAECRRHREAGLRTDAIRERAARPASLVRIRRQPLAPPASRARARPLAPVRRPRARPLAPMRRPRARLRAWGAARQPRSRPCARAAGRPRASCAPGRVPGRLPRRQRAWVPRNRDGRGASRGGTSMATDAWLPEG
nr:unnamed protein product [Digitaria exilis]CAB3503324.1 unnamed protein product [Digitaria exilis]